ncbi:MAG: TonB-dependent receptor, partial [Terriglobia bacterium]
LGFISVQRLDAQSLYGSMSGTVTDQSGAVIPGAAITIINQDTHLTRSTTTGSAGDYRVIDLPAGTYTVRVAAKGFRTVSDTGVTVNIGSVSAQNVRLSLGAVTQAVTVNGSAATLQTETTDVHTTISKYAINNLPTSIYHNFQNFELLTPGLTSTTTITGSYPNSIADAPDRSLDINTNGLSAHINTTRVDGATDQFLWLPDHMVIVPPQASVEEVNVQTSNFSVQKGLTAGAATDVVTKSGTNQFHGQLYGYFTNASLDAVQDLVYEPTKPQYLVNNDGVAIGGPIKHNKLFFFGNWDGYYQREEAADIGLIPPTDMRQGNFSSYLGAPLYNANGTPATVCTTGGGTTQLLQGMVFDPQTGNPATGQGRCAFQGNIIPANRMYQGSTNFWQLMAPYVPNYNLGTPFNQFTADNSLELRKSDWNRNVFTGKVDWNISDRQLMWIKYTAQKAFLNDGSDYGVAGQGNGTGLTHDLAQTWTLGHSWTVKPDLILSGHVGFVRMSESNHTLDFGKDYGTSVLGLVNSNTPTGNILYSGMPGINMADFTTLGTDQSWEPMQRDAWQLTLDENGTWIKGKHTITFGFDANHNHMNAFQPEIVCCDRGFINTADNNTFINVAPVGTPGGTQQQFYDSTGAPVGFNSGPWNDVAEFDMGLGSEMENSQQFIKATNKDWQYSLYAGDTFRVTPKLTVNAGLRWSYFPLITRDGASKFEVYDTATNTEMLGGLGGNPTHLGVTSSKKLFAPRLGIAYQIRQNTVIRTAYGISEDTLPLERPLRGFYPYTIGADDFLPGNSNITTYLPYANFNATTNTANAVPGLANGVPLIAAPTGFSSGAITPPGNVTIGTLAPGPFKRGYVQFWNFTVQQKLPGNMLLSVGYVGNHLAHQFNGVEANAATLGSGSAGQPLFAAFGRTSDTYLFQGYLDSHYNSLQVSLKRQVSHGLFLQGAYTYSKAIGYMDDEGWEDGLDFNCPASTLMPQGCQALNRHTLAFDHTHNLKMAYVYTLPFGVGQKWANTSRAARAILGGWQTNGILTIMTGAPLFPSQTNVYLNTPFTDQVPDFAGNLQRLGQTGPGQQYFNTTAFSPLQTVQIGNAGESLSWLRGPGIATLDASLFRTFKLTERFKLQMRIQAQNFTNTPQWSNPNMTCTIVNGVCGGGFGQVTGATDPRIIQIGAQLEF